MLFFKYAKVILQRKVFSINLCHYYHFNKGRVDVIEERRTKKKKTINRGNFSITNEISV